MTTTGTHRLARIAVSIIAAFGFVVALKLPTEQCCSPSLWHDMFTWPNIMTGEGRADFYLVLLLCVVAASITTVLWVPRRFVVAVIAVGTVLAASYFAEPLLNVVAASWGVSYTSWNMFQHEWITWRLVVASVGASVAAAGIATVVAATVFRSQAPRR